VFIHSGRAGQLLLAGEFFAVASVASARPSPLTR